MNWTLVLALIELLGLYLSVQFVVGHPYDRKLLPGAEIFDNCGLTPGLNWHKKEVRTREYESRRNNRGSRRRSKISHVANGLRTEPGDFPSHVQVANWPTWSHRKCGGTLIGPQLVITAARCLTDLDRKSMVVFVGANSPGKRMLKGYVVEEMCVSPSFCYDDKVRPESPPDVALLTLVHPVEYNDYVQPACINFNKEALLPNQLFELPGYGITEYSDVKSEELRFVQMTPGCLSLPDLNASSTAIFSPIECYRPDKHDSRTCVGDLGGGIYYVNPFTNRHLVTGHMYHGNHDCEPSRKDSYFVNYKGSGIFQHLLGLQNHCTRNFTNIGDRMCPPPHQEVTIEYIKPPTTFAPDPKDRIVTQLRNRHDTHRFYASHAWL